MARSLYGGEEATFTRRFFGDNMLEGVLQVCTLFIGWLIWLAIVAPKGQTPAKQLLNIRIHDYRSGEIASGRSGLDARSRRQAGAAARD